MELIDATVKSPSKMGMGPRLKSEIIFSTRWLTCTKGVSMTGDSQASKDAQLRQIERALARLEEAVSRCREEDVRTGPEF